LRWKDVYLTDDVLKSIRIFSLELSSNFHRRVAKTNFFSVMY